MDASRSATIYIRDDTSAQQLYYYINLFVNLLSLTSQLVNTTGIPYVCTAFCNSLISMRDLMMTT